MSRQPYNAEAIAPISPENTTALILINNQLGFRNTNAWGSGVSNPHFEANVKKLIDAYRKAAEGRMQGDRIVIIHAQHRSVWTDDPLFPGHIGPYGPDGESKRGVDFLEFAAPLVNTADGPRLVYTFDEPTASTPPAVAGEIAGSQNVPRKPSDEFIMTSHEHSVFINTPLESLLRSRGIRTLLIAGLTLDRSISTAVRMAHNLAVVGKWGGKGNMEDTARSSLWTDGKAVYATATATGANEEDSKLGDEEEMYTVDMPRIILVEDATMTFGKGGIDAETVHRVHIESLREFAEIRSTADVVKALGSVEA
jgi:nicotinamidase-related amidase